MANEKIKNATKLLLGGTASIGAGAIIAYLLRGQNLTGMKGIGKLFTGIGISGLALAAGSAASEAMENTIDNTFVLIEGGSELIDFVNYKENNIEKETENADDVVD